MIEDWSKCMQKARYRYPDLDKMLLDRRWRLRDTDTPQPGEVQAALADWDCKKKVNYLGFMVALYSAYQKRFISEHAEELRQYRAGLNILIENAGDVLGSKKK